MRKYFYSFSVFIIIMLTGCNKGGPGDVAKTWLTDFYRLDYDGARKLSTDDTKNFISQLEQFADAVSDSEKRELKKATVSIKNLKANDSTATLTYTVSDMPGKDQPLVLVKQGDRWLVQFSKIDRPATLDSTMRQPMEQPDTSTQVQITTGEPVGDTSKH